jgi:hypothetical protein
VIKKELYAIIQIQQQLVALLLAHARQAFTTLKTKIATQSKTVRPTNFNTEKKYQVIDHRVVNNAEIRARPAKNSPQQNELKWVHQLPG